MMSLILNNMPAGCPSKYNPSLCDTIIELMGQGMAIEEVCLELKICKQTFYNWTEKHPEFLYAKKKGEDLSKAWWMKMGRENLENNKFNHGLWYMNMKNRFGWTDRTEYDHSNKDGSLRPVQINVLSEKGTQKLRDFHEYISKLN